MDSLALAGERGQSSKPCFRHCSLETLRSGNCWLLGLQSSKPCFRHCSLETLRSGYISEAHHTACFSQAVIPLPTVSTTTHRFTMPSAWSSRITPPPKSSGQLFQGSGKSSGGLLLENLRRRRAAPSPSASIACSIPPRASSSSIVPSSPRASSSSSGYSPRESGDKAP